MKTKIFIMLLLVFSLFKTNIYLTEASSLFNSNTSDVIYCDDDECGLDKGTQIVSEGINGIETTVTFSEFVQNIVTYLLTFISIIAVIYIIYAGFSIMISQGNEDVQKKQKSNIFSIVIGIVLIWLSYTIVTFIINLANQGGTN